MFTGATFSGDALFTRATFSGLAWFDGAAFSSSAWFDAWFDGVTFCRCARFARATFSGGESSLFFDRSRVLSPSPDPPHEWPTGWCLGPDGSGGYTVVRANDNGHS
jgi:Pentapeptide repeats (9 copies)